MDIKNFTSRMHSFVQDRQRMIAMGCLLAILLLGAFLRFHQLGEAGIGNSYYAATVKSMLVSWRNFFFAAFEPGGSVSVDKPPLGFWIEAISAYFLGVNGLALALPNAMAGVLSIFVIYKLIRRPFGRWAGLAAALALAVTPVAIVTERNNTIDGMLVFVLLTAAWAFLQSVYTGRVRWLFLGVFMVGLGFNIKMLQAFLPLPAFYALYFFGAKYNLWKKFLHLAAATALLLVVSFSWAIIVDLTPAANRPYVDSTSHNSALELIFGHNGIERLINSHSGAAPGGPGVPQGHLPQPPAEQGFPPGMPPRFANGQGFPPPSTGINGGPGPMDNGQPGGQGSMDFGTPGSLRLFTAPLVGEASWLLPFVLGGLIVLAIVLWKRPFGAQHLSFILWAGWLIPEAVYFTYSRGLMHAYYLIMVGAPIAALAAMTLWGLWQVIQKQWIQGLGLAFLLAGGTLVFEMYTLLGKTTFDLPAVVVAGVLLGTALLLAVAGRQRVRFATAALGLLLAAMLVAPGIWSVLTTFNSSPNSGLPYAGPAQPHAAPNGIRARTDDSYGNPMMMPLIPEDGPRPALPLGGPEISNDPNLLKYLLANTRPGTYLVATGQANSAASFILETGRPVLTFGGFLGQYDEVSVEQLSTLVKNGQLRFVLGDGLDRHQSIAKWVRQNCTIVNRASPAGAGSPASNTTLFDCGN